MRKILILSVFLVLVGLKSFADYTVAAGQNINASTITAQSGVLTINGTLTVSSNVSLSGFKSVIINCPGQIYWSNNSDLTFAAGTSFNVNGWTTGSTCGLQPTAGNGNASQRLIIGTTIIAVSSDHSNNAAYSFEDFNGAGGLPQFTFSLSQSVICANSSITGSVTPLNSNSYYDCYWTISPSTGGTFSPSSSTNFNTGSQASVFTAASGASGPYTISCKVTHTGDNDPIITKTFSITINPNPTVNVGGAMAAICQGRTSAALGGSFGGGAISAIWSDGGAGGSFTNNGGSTPNTTTYTASASSGSPVTLTLTTSGGSCGTTSASKTIAVNPSQTISSTSISVQCLGDAASISTTATGVSAYQWQLSTDGGSTWSNLTNSSPYSGTTTQTLGISSTNIAMTSYYYRITGISPCGSVVQSGSIPIRFTNEWLGTTSKNWNTASNWLNNQLPSFASCGTVVIPSGTTYSPQLTTNTTVTNLAITAGANLDLNGNTLQIDGIFTGSSTGYLRGSNSSGLIIAGSAGSLYFDPSNNSLKTLTINSTGSVMLSNALNITAGSAYGTVTVDGTLDANNNLTLKSDVNGTASVGQSRGKINGYVTVERFVPPLRAWRFLTVPFSSSTQTINDAWQEGVHNTDPSLNYLNNQDPNPGFGTHITGNNANNSFGYDYNTTGNPSIKVWDPTIGGWDAAEPATISTNIASYKAYCVFVRGSRAVNLAWGTSAPTDPTILRATGVLNQNGSSYLQNYSGATGNIILVGNPYASSIDITSLLIRSSGIDVRKFWVWDPKRTGAGTNNVGGYVSYSNDLTVPYNPSPSYPDAASATIIESGQAFMVQLSGSGSASASMKFNETDKVTTQSNTFGRPAAEAQPVPAVYTNLMVPTASGLFLADGVATGFGSRFSASVDGDDAVKLWNFDENLALVRGSSTLGIEFRPVPLIKDTLFYRMYLRQEPYILKIFTQDFEGQPLRAWLVDKYLNAKTEVNLHDTTLYSFTPNKDTNSYRNRFMIVFNRVFTATPVPVTRVVNQQNPNTTGAANSMAAAPTSGVSIYPNPVTTDGMVTLQFGNMDKGKYEVTVYSPRGQKLASRKIEYGGGDNIYPLPLNPSWAAGIYTISVTNEDSKRAINLRLVIDK